MGIENIAFYLGGEEGYSADRVVELPGCAAVDCVPVDLNDDGQPEVVVVNCAENAPTLDPGSIIYWGKDGKFSPDNHTAMYTVTGHGCATGDFRHCGYIDMIFTGIQCRELFWIKGGPDGYAGTAERIILGDHPEECTPKMKKRDGVEIEYTEEESKRMTNFAGPRWIFAADFNNDGWLDLFVPQIAGPRASILWGSSDGFKWENRQELAVDGVVTGNAADLTGNGYLDLICSGFHSKGKDNVKETYLTVYWGSENGYSENRKSQIPVFCSNDLTINDFNGDGNLDVFSAAYHGGRSRDVDSSLYFGKDDGSFSRYNCQKIRNLSCLKSSASC